MNRIILTFAVILLSGCSSTPIKTTDTAFQSSDNTQVFNSTTTYQARQNSVLQLNNTDEATQQESLFPRIAHYIKQGVASWYGPRFHGKKTATGEIFDMYAMTAAHKTLPIPSYAQVTNLENNRSIVVRINDRGPFIGGRELDLSYAAAKNLDMKQNGTGAIEIKAISAAQALPHMQRIAARQEQQVYLQVGSFGSAKKALKLKNKISAYNLPEPDIRSSTYKKSTLYKVQMGPIRSTASANQLSQQLAEIGILDTQFVTESKQSESSRVTM